jgi:hypothetical protein
VPRSRVPDDLDEIIRANKEVKSQTSRQHILLNVRSLRSPNAKSRFRDTQPHPDTLAQGNGAIIHDKSKTTRQTKMSIDDYSQDDFVNIKFG